APAPSTRTMCLMMPCPLRLFSVAPPYERRSNGGSRLRRERPNLAVRDDAFEVSIRPHSKLIGRVDVAAELLAPNERKKDAAVQQVGLLRHQPMARNA